MQDKYIAGKHSVIEALQSGRTINKIWISSQTQKHLIASIITEAKKVGTVVQTVDKRKLDQMVGEVKHQGVVAQVAAHKYVNLEDILAHAEHKGEAPFLLLLDEIEDPHNLGAILRTADCTGVHGVVIPKRRSVGLTATVAKTSAGAIEYVPVAQVTNLVQTMQQLKERNIWIIGTDTSATQDIYEAELFSLPIALVIGNENEGMGRLVREHCDLLYKLPMVGRISSLNASVAAGIFMYEVARRRRG